jgi:hypothetical protein
MAPQSDAVPEEQEKRGPSATPVIASGRRLKMRFPALVAGLVLSCAATSSLAEDKKDERAGNCADAKQQMAYFCDESNTANDMMLALGTACNNAKKNVAAACEGKGEADQVYQFDDKSKK